MRCPSCGFDNLEGMEFCTECGARLQQSCPRCSFVNPPQAKFCGKCGTALTVRPKGKKTKGGKARKRSSVRTSRPPASYTPSHLAERIRAEQAAMEARGVSGGERKLVTHLFSDLKGSTALIEGLDPEEARAIVDPALQLMMDAVHRYEGYVAQVPGDGIFALFGAPIAHEDHPQRALYAALLMQEEMRRYSDQLREQGHPPLLMRIGVNTGEVVVRSIRKEDLHTDYIPVGRSTNIAARMEQLAAPGSILVSEQTHKLTAGYFEFKPLGKTQVKGIEAPLNVYEVLGAGPLRTRLQVAARRGLTRFVGRYVEMEQLQKALEQAKAGHEQTAEAIETLYSAKLEDHYSDLAHHYSRSGNTQKAMEYLQLAGQQATQRSAYAEAISHLTAALELLKTLPDTPERERQELTVQLALGPVLMATKGYAAAEVKQAYARARELCRRVGETPQLVPVLGGLAGFYSMRGELQTAHELAEQLLRLAQRVQDSAFLILAHRVCGAGLYLRGELVAALEHVEQGMALYDPQQHHAQAVLGLVDSGVVCRGYAAWVLWLLGYPDQARQRLHEALTLAQELSHPNSLVAALMWAVGIYQWRREMEAVHEQAEALMALSTEQGLPFPLAVGTMWQGWARAHQEEGEAGIRQVRQGLTHYQATGAVLFIPDYLGLLAEAYQQVGEAEEGLAVLTEALTVVDRTGEQVYAAELHRLKGTLTLQSKVRGPKSEVEEEAEACFQRTLAVARRQQAKSWELRAATSLARLWQQQGKTAEARELLAPVYSWFTEGFDTKDLQEAKALLEELTQ